MPHSDRLWLEAPYRVLIPAGSNVCHQGYAFTELQTVQMSGVYSAVYDTVHYKEPLKAFKNVKTLFEHLFVAILPRLCRKRRNAIFTHLLRPFTQSVNVGTAVSRLHRPLCRLSLTDTDSSVVSNCPHLTTQMSVCVRSAQRGALREINVDTLVSTLTRRGRH